MNKILHRCLDACQKKQRLFSSDCDEGDQLGEPYRYRQYRLQDYTTACLRPFSL